MINFLFRKIWRNRWLMLCLIMGNVLLIGIVAGIPMYMTATTQRIFQQDLRAVRYTQNTFPAFIQMRYTFNVVSADYRLPTYFDTRDVRWPEIIEEIGIPVAESLRTYVMGAHEAKPVVPRTYPPIAHRFLMAGSEGFMENIEITHGRLPSNELVDGNTIEAVVMARTLTRHRLLMDELMVMTEITNGGEPMYLRIVGIYTIPDEAGAFWSVMPMNPMDTLLISDELIYERFVRNYIGLYRMHVTWTEILDHTEMTIFDLEHYETVINATREWYNESGIWFFHQNLLTVIVGQGVRPAGLETTLWVLLIPMFVMLTLYIYMVSRQILLMDRNGISVLQSRGASRTKIIGLYAMQGLFVGLVSIPIGILLGAGLCMVLGASNGFLDFVQRDALRVFVTPEAVVFAVLAAGLSFLPMFLPVIRFSKIGIVEFKTSKAGKPRKTFWQRYYLDFLIFGIAVYGVFSFGNPQALAVAAMAAEERGADPLLFATTSLFILGAGLICLRIFPYLVRLVFWAGKRLWSPSLYASMLKVMRSAGEEQFIMLFLIFTVSIGIFSAQAARTINLNNEHVIRYNAGADLTFLRLWDSNVREGLPVPPVIVHVEPDFSKFTHFEELDNITRVVRIESNARDAFPLLGGGDRLLEGVQLMAIETDTFGETVWFRDDLLRIHINYFLNALASRPDGILVSDNFRTILGYEIGDTIVITEDIRGSSGSSGRFVIVGFIDYWPGFIPVERTLLETLEVIETPASLAIINLDHMVTSWGMRPYHVWMRTNTDSSQFLHDFIRDFNAERRYRTVYERIHLLDFFDTRSALVEVRSDPIVQGTNGVFTVSFIAILLVCFTGFLIYWILSIRSRILQFGIFRAMGLGMRGIVGLLINEQLLITLTALAIGAFVGEISARLFVPLIQISFSPADQSIPLLVVMEARDYGNLYITIGAMVLLCMLVIVSYISRIKIAQVLKLGED